MSKTIILGGTGFVGKALLPHLPDAHVVNLRLDNYLNVSILSDLIKEGDTIIMLAALTPGRGTQQEILSVNIRMMENVLAAIGEKKIAHFINFSTDSVYPIDDEDIHEEKMMQPDSLYGYSHLIREKMLLSAIDSRKVTIFRPTGIYGIGDTHNSYGLNRFIRDAKETGIITLFGEGEDIRSHVYIDDVVNIVLHAHRHFITGDYNIGSLHSCTFRALAERVHFYIGGAIRNAERKSGTPITKRTFNLEKLISSFPPPRSPLVGARDMIHAIQSA